MVRTVNHDSDLTDVEGAFTSNEGGEPMCPMHMLVWRGGAESRVVDNPSEVQPGEIVVLPSSMGG